MLDPMADFDCYDFPNWGGYGEEPILKATVDKARAVHAALLGMQSPPWHAAPGGDGSIGFEADDLNGRSAWVDVESNRTRLVLFSEHGADYCSVEIEDPSQLADRIAEHFTQ